MKPHKQWLRITALLIVLILMGFVLAGCTKTNETQDTETAEEESIITETFTYWISAGIDSSYYSDYRDSPVYTYLLNKTWDTANGKVKLDFDFIIPVAGSETDNFNTLLATGEYAEIMELSKYTGSILELFEDGTIIDLTEYVEAYMPNYIAWLERNPTEKIYATNVVDGEQKYLVLYSGADTGKAWCGYMYRRDWVVKYGKNPVDGSAFSGEYTVFDEDGTPDPESWTDNVVFPSGGTDPVYISDWEWMFEIFDTARETLGITDGYNISIYYPGYLRTGDLVCSFGGGGPQWYIDQDGKIVFGATGDDFRTYLEAMNSWYEKGWLDKAFAEHSSDIFYRIDETSVRQGKVGMWIGISSQLLNGMDTGAEYTEGIITYPAANPINDVYGSEEQMNVVPYTMYSNSVLGPDYGISDKTEGKDLEALFRFFDYLYTDEGALVGHFTAEQIAELNLPIYEKYGLEGGTFQEVETENGIKLMPVDTILNEGGNLKLAVMGKRGLSRDPNSLTLETSLRVEEMREVWNTYANTGGIPQAFYDQLSADDGKIYSKAQVSIDEFMQRHVPNFINGSKDITNDEEWESFIKALNKYKPEVTTEILQNQLDILTQEN